MFCIVPVSFTPFIQAVHASLHKNRWSKHFLKTSASAGFPHAESELSEVPRNMDEDNHHVNGKGGLNIFKSKRPKRAVYLPETVHIPGFNHLLEKLGLKV